MEAFIAFGSNLGNRLGNLSEAKRRLLELPQIQLLAASPVYETEPIDCSSSTKPFFNSVVQIETTLSSHDLLDATQQIEESMGREKTRPKNRPRQIDLDLLCCDNLILSDGRLTLPTRR